MAYVSRHALGATSTDPLAPVRAGSLLLKRGSKGDAVRALQTLIRQGQTLDGAASESLIVVDGDFGPKTESFVRILQKALGVVVDGIVGKQTIAALEAALGSAPKASVAADFSARTPVKPLTKAEAIAQAKEKAKAAAAAKVNAMRQRGIADAKAGKYAPPAPPAPSPDGKPVPDYDTMNYQSGWISTGKPLPPGVILIGAGGVAVTSAEAVDSGASPPVSPPAPAGDTGKNTMIAVGILGAAAVAAVFMLKK
jgi:peptidoglycan hydrolase-like protein with peptidoglycan-binding domain